MKKSITVSELSWDQLNEAIRGADEKTCHLFLQDEMEGRKRPTYVMRIHSRLNKVRADRERKELEAKL